MTVAGDDIDLVKANIFDIRVGGNIFYFSEGNGKYAINFDSDTTNPPAASAALFEPIFIAFVNSKTGVVIDVSIVDPLPAGTNIIGKVGIDQTTPGTTNGIVINNSGTETFSSSTVTDSAASPVAAGKKSITFTTSSDFVGTILGVARAASTTYSFSADNPSRTLAAIPYTVTAGSMIIDVSV